MIGEAIVCSGRAPYRSKTGLSDRARSTLNSEALVVEICLTRPMSPEGTSASSMSARNRRLASRAETTQREALKVSPFSVETAEARPLSRWSSRYLPV